MFLPLKQEPLNAILSINFSPPSHILKLLFILSKPESSGALLNFIRIMIMLLALNPQGTLAALFFILQFLVTFLYCCCSIFVSVYLNGFICWVFRFIGGVVYYHVVFGVTFRPYLVCFVLLVQFVFRL